MPNIASNYYWKVVVGALLTFAFLLVNTPHAFADVKAVVVIECDPHNGVVNHAQASAGSPVTASQVLGQQCADVMVFLDAAHFKVKETLRGVSATTINEVPIGGGSTSPWWSNYLYVFFLD